MRVEREHVNVIQPLYPAARDHGNVHAPRQVQSRVDIAAFQHSIAANVREQQTRNTCVLKPAGEIDNGHVRNFGPALGCDHAIPGINRDNDAAFPLLRHFLDEFGIFQRG